MCTITTDLVETASHVTTVLTPSGFSVASSQAAGSLRDTQGPEDTNSHPHGATPLEIGAVSK